jgi:copper chaperone
MQTVELKVGMSCQGCVGAVKRVLGKMEGCYSFLVIDIDFPIYVLVEPIELELTHSFILSPI